MLRVLLSAMMLPLAAWLASLLLLEQGSGFFFWVHQLLIVTGMLALVLMAGIMLLALRLPAVERALGGLDKSYRLHKYGGIAAGILLGLHWLLQQSKHWAVDLGWVTVGSRGPHGSGFSIRSLAESVGEWAFYALLALILISLLQQISYRRFRLVHKAAGVIFLAGAFHSVVLLPAGWLFSPAGVITMIAAIVGGIAALFSLSGRIGTRRRQHGVITRITPLGNDTLEVAIQLAQGWSGYRAGQFAFVTFDPSEGAHPFTVVRYQPEEQLLTFAIKALGDYTGKLAGSLHSQQQVEVEGPYGRFNRPEDGSHQVWIGAGIGITPFVAWLESLAHTTSPTANVDLYYCVRHREQAVYAPRLQALQEKVPGVRLHLLADDEQCRLHASELVKQTTPSPEIWFCGPSGFAKTLQQGLRQLGLPSQRFHRELFELR